MKLFTLATAFLLLFMFASCERSLDENLTIDKVESIERAFYFTPEIKDGQELSKAYTINADLEEITEEGAFEAKWGDEQDFYSFEFIPAENEARLMKFFGGKECVEVAEVEMIERANKLRFQVIEDEKGAITFTLGEKVLFQNVANDFRPSSGRYIGKGGLSVRNFQLIQ